MALNSLPLATQDIDQTQAPIKANFDGINAGFAVDHEELQPGSIIIGNEGKHKKATFTLQGSTPIFGADEIGLAEIVWTPSGTKELMYRKGSGTDYPLTAGVGSQVVNFTDKSAAFSVSCGWYSLPNGWIAKYGHFVCNQTFAGIIVNLDAITPKYNTSLDTLQVFSSLSSLNYFNDSKSGFTVRLASGGMVNPSFYFFTIGH